MEQILEELYPNKEDKVLAQNNLSALMATPGWLVIDRVLTAMIKNFEQDILSDEEMDITEEHKLKLTRNDYVFFKQMPRLVAQSLSEELPNQLPNDDPFEVVPPLPAEEKTTS